MAAEIVEIANDEEKLKESHIFMLPGIYMVDHIMYFTNKHIVNNAEEFQRGAIEVIKSKLELMRSFYESEGRRFK